MRHVQLVPLNANVEKTNFGMVLLMRFNAEVSFYLGEGLLIKLQMVLVQYNLFYIKYTYGRSRILEYHLTDIH